MIDTTTTDTKFSAMRDAVRELLTDLQPTIADDYTASEEPAHYEIADTEISTWFERDRAHVNLTCDGGQRTLVEWWDEEVSEVVEEGFLDPKDWHGSAYDYARERDLTTIPAMQITVASSDGETWAYQTGDNSYTGACYFEHYWGVGALYRGADAEEIDELATELVDQIFEQIES